MTAALAQSYDTLPGMAYFPVKASVLWPDEQDGPWVVTVWWRVQYGVPTPVGLAMTSWWGAGLHDDQTRPSGDAEMAFPRLEGAHLRDLPMSQILQRTRELAVDELRSSAGRWRNDGLGAMASAYGLDEQAEALQTQRGGRDLGDAHYREVAAVYAQAVRDDRPPTQAVADHFDITKSGAARKVARARERRFLPPSGGRGRRPERIQEEL